MSKLKKTVKAFKAIAQKPYLLNLVLEEDENHKKALLQNFPEMETLPQISLSELAGSEHFSVETFLLDGSSMVTDLALLKTLAKGKKSYFEIGTWRGESVWNVASEIDDCTTFNLPAHELKQMNFPKEYINLHGILSKNNSKIKHLEGNSSTFDFSKLNKKFDLIFIDGDHHYEMVKSDTEKVFASLTHDKSVVVWHDFAFSPEKIRYEVYRGIVEGLPANKRQNLYHVANTMCAVLLPENRNTQKFETPKKPDTLFTVNLKISEFG